jgi:hypothetical protein
VDSVIFRQELDSGLKSYSIPMKQSLKELEAGLLYKKVNRCFL